MKNSTWLSAALFWFGLVFLLVAIRWPLITSSGLFADDLIVFPKALAGASDPLSSLPVLMPFLELIIQSTGSVSGARFFTLMIIALGGVAWFLIVQSVLGSIRGGIAVLVAFVVPVAITQGVFLNGSHPALAMVFLAWGIWFTVVGSTQSSKALTCLCYCAAMLLLVVSVATSVLVWLCSLGLLVLSGFHFARKRYGHFVAVSVCALGPMVFLGVRRLLDSTTKYHYESTGWTNYSIQSMVDRALDNLNLFVEMHLLPLSNWQLGAVSGLLFVAVTVLYWRFQNAGCNSKSLPGFEISVFAMLVVVGGLAFAPALTVSTSQERYLFLPTSIVVMSCIGLLFYLLQSRFSQAVIAGLSAAFMVSFVVTSVELLKHRYERNFDVQSLLAAKLMEHRDGWDTGAQILIVIDDMPSGFSSGYNHWSTHFLRRSMGRSDINGLIGTAGWMTELPFIQAYEDHGGKYWKKNSKGQSRRRRMFGIVEGAPLYAYSFDVDGNLSEVRDLIFDMQGAIKLLRVSESISTREVGDASDVCSSFENGSAIVFSQPYQLKADPLSSVDVPLRPSVGFKDGLANSYDFTGSEELQYELLHRQDDFLLSMRLTSKSADYGGGRYTDIYPPMPLLWTPYVVQQISQNEFKIGGKAARRVEIDDELRLSIRRRGCVTEYQANEYYWREWGVPLPQRKISIGKGYLQRFWRGTVRDFRLEITSANEQVQTIDLEGFRKI